MEINKQKVGNNTYCWVHFTNVGEQLTGKINKINVDEESEKKSYILLTNVTSNTGDEMPGAIFFNILPWMVDGFKLAVDKCVSIKCTEIDGTLKKIDITPVKSVHDDWLVHDKAGAPEYPRETAGDVHEPAQDDTINDDESVTYNTDRIHHDLEEILTRIHLYSPNLEVIQRVERDVLDALLDIDEYRYMRGRQG